MKALPALLLWCLGTGCLLHAASPDLEGDRRELMANVADFAFSGSPGVLLGLGDHTVSLIHNQEGWSLALALRSGQGRALVLSQGIDANTAPGAIQFLRNSLRWTRQGRESLPVLVLNAAPMAKRLRQDSIPVATAARLPDSLEGYSLIYLGFPWSVADDYTQAEIARLHEYVRAGGGLMAHGLGWTYPSYHEAGIARPMLHEWSANRIFGPLGCWFGSRTAGPARPFSETGPDLSADIAQALEVIEGRAGASAAWIDAFLVRLLDLVDISGQQCQVLSPAMTSLLVARHAALGKRGQPGPGQPLPASDTAARLAVGLLAVLEPVLPPSTVTSPGSAALFPGTAGGSPLASTWSPLPLTGLQGTGLYAPAGASITVRQTGGSPTSFTLRIGAHSDVLIGRKNAEVSWHRWPVASWHREASTGQVSLASSHGGLVYLELPAGAPAASFEISGAVPALRFRLGTDTNATWTRILASARTPQAPWGELEGERLVLVLPAATLRKVKDPERIIAFWDRAIRELDSLTGDSPRSRKERIVIDEQTAYGYMHGGYPVVCQMDNADIAAGLPGEWDIFRVGSWGLFHELGHNWQKTRWIFDGSWEVTVNIFTIWLMDRLVGIAPGEHPYLRDAVPAGQAYKAAGRDFSRWNESYMVAALFFVDLIKTAGWDSFKAFYREMSAALPHELPATDAAIRDQWLERLSRNARKDLRPVFQDWGIPFSPQALTVSLAPRPTLIEAGFNGGDGYLYLFHGSTWAKYSIAAKALVPGFPRPITPDWPFPWKGSPDFAFAAETKGQFWIGKGPALLLWDLPTNKPVPGAPTTIAQAWPGVWPEGIDAGTPYGDGKLYLFRGDSYHTWDIARQRLDSAAPTLTATGWRGINFDTIDEVIEVDRNFWFFRRGWVSNYRHGSGGVGKGYPHRVEQDWPGIDLWQSP